MTEAENDRLKTLQDKIYDIMSRETTFVTLVLGFQLINKSWLKKAFHSPISR